MPRRGTVCLVSRCAGCAGCGALRSIRGRVGAVAAAWGGALRSIRPPGVPGCGCAWCPGVGWLAGGSCAGLPVGPGLPGAPAVRGCARGARCRGPGPRGARAAGRPARTRPHHPQLVTVPGLVRGVRVCRVDQGGAGYARPAAGQRPAGRPTPDPHPTRHPAPTRPNGPLRPAGPHHGHAPQGVPCTRRVHSPHGDRASGPHTTVATPTPAHHPATHPRNHAPTQAGTVWGDPGAGPPGTPPPHPRARADTGPASPRLPAPPPAPARPQPRPEQCGEVGRGNPLPTPTHPREPDGSLRGVRGGDARPPRGRAPRRPTRFTPALQLERL